MKTSSADYVGFTLVELLVVVAIIDILMAILLPAVSMAREKARQALCIGQLKDIGIAMMTWHNNAGGFPMWDLPKTHHPWMDCAADELNGWAEMMGMVEDSITATSTSGSCARRASAVIQPAVPPPMIPTVRTPWSSSALGRDASRTRSSWLVKSSCMTGSVNWILDADVTARL